MITENQRNRYFHEHGPEITNLIWTMVNRGISHEEIEKEIRAHIDERIENTKSSTQK